MRILNAHHGKWQKKNLNNSSPKNQRKRKERKKMINHENKTTSVKFGTANKGNIADIEQEKPVAYATEAAVNYIDAEKQQPKRRIDLSDIDSEKCSKIDLRHLCE